MNKKTISILRESMPHEHRVIALPRQVKRFCGSGFRVLVESGAGARVGYNDDEYRAVGAEIVSTEQAWAESDFIVKYKPPIMNEYKYLRPDSNLGAIFHAEGNRSLIEALLESRITAYSFEFFRTDGGIFPLAIPGGEIAGKLAVIYGAYHLQRHLGGAGKLLVAMPNVAPTKVLIIGYGNVGGAAARTAAALGADVLVLGRNKEALRRFQGSVGSNVRTAVIDRVILEQELPTTDILIGAILISTFDTPSVVDEHLVKRMRPGSVIVDATAGYGPGYLSTFDKSTDFFDPTYERFGVLHCKIDNLPASVPITSSQAYAEHIAPYLVELGDAIYSRTPNPVSDRGKIVEDGRIVHPVLKQHYDYYRSSSDGRVGI